MSGDHVVFRGEAMAAVIAGICEVEAITGIPPVVVGGLAVLARLSHPYRATSDLDVVDRGLEGPPHLELLRAATGARAVEPAAALLTTVHGEVKVDVLEVRQPELDHPSDDPGDRLHARAHAWAHATATQMRFMALIAAGPPVTATALVAEPGPLVAMKLQAIMNRSAAKQGTDLLDIVRLVLDPALRGPLLQQVGSCDPGMTADIAQHVRHWFQQRRGQSLRRMQDVDGGEIHPDDLDLVAELLLAACAG